MPYAEVAVDAPIRGPRTFTYLIPNHLSVTPGQMVQVPFGPRMTDGVVFHLSETTSIELVRPIQAADPLGSVVSPIHLDLARWISDYYLSSLYSAVALMLPPGLRTRTSSYVQRPDDSALDSLDASLREAVVAAFAPRKSRLAESVLRRSVGAQHHRTLDRLISSGTLQRIWAWSGSRPLAIDVATPANHAATSESALVPTSSQIEALTAITDSIQAARNSAYLLHGVTGSGKTEVYLQALDRCLALGRSGIVLVPEISLTPQLERRFEARFPGCVAVLHSRLSSAEHRRIWWAVYHGQYDIVIGSRSALFAPLSSPGLIVLDEEHDWSYKQHDPDPRYHARAVALQMASQFNAVVVLGSATPDLVTHNRALAGRSIHLLSLPYRLDAQTQVQEPSRGVMAGTMEGKSPRRLRDPGSGELAVPPGTGPVREGKEQASVTVVDMRQELREGNRSIFSLALQQSLMDTIARGDQAILFINRRGTAGVVQCRDCGQVVRCHSCNTPLTYHASPERLVCHQCNRRSPVTRRCSNCHSQRIRYLGLGTQRVVREMEALVPGVSILRWDRDVAEDADAPEGIVDMFADGRAQVLVGTQMVAKSLHIPAVTLVGAVLADIGLHLPDFRAGERVFQLLCQVAGRAGRGPSPGTAIVQTYRPDHYAVALAADQDYTAFYNKELEFRREQRLPPFNRLIRLLYANTNEATAQREAQHMGRVLAHQRRSWAMSEVDIIGPAPAYPTRVRGRYRWHLLIRGPDPRLLLDKSDLPEGWVVDVDPVSVL